VIVRRTWLAGVGALFTAGCDAASRSPRVQKTLAAAEGLNLGLQRLFLANRAALAREYPESAIDKDFRGNGTINPDDPDYQAAAEAGFKDWRLVVDGLVEQPLSLSLEDLRALPARTQITRHDCVEGWSAIAKWTGVPLAHVLALARAKPEALYVVFHCADELELTLDGSGRYYESIDLVDAHHPQTILAYAMNDAPLPIANGAPLRLRVERQLGYKMAKYVMRIELAESLAAFGRGQGGYWEDRGYEWYAGI